MACLNVDSFYLRLGVTHLLNGAVLSLTIDRAVFHFDTSFECLPKSASRKSFTLQDLPFLALELLTYKIQSSAYGI